MPGAAPGFAVKKDQEFSLKPEEQIRYKLVDVQSAKAVIVNTKNQMNRSKLVCSSLTPAASPHDKSLLLSHFFSPSPAFSRRGFVRNVSRRTLTSQIAKRPTAAALPQGERLRVGR